MNHRPIAALALAALAASAVLGQGPVTLRLSLKPGQKLTYVMTGSTASSGLMANTSSTSITTSYTVMSGGKSGWEVLSRLDALSLEAAKGSPRNETLSQAMQKMVGTTARLTYNEFGRLIGQPTGTDMMRAMSQTPGNGFMGMVYPRSTVNVGWTWQDVFDLSNLLKSAPKTGLTTTGGTIPIHYRLRGFSMRAGKRVAIIEVTAKGTLGAKSTASASSQGKGMEMNTTFDMTSLATVDIGTGIPLEVQITSSSDMAMKGGGMDMSVKSNVRMTIKLK